MDSEASARIGELSLAINKLEKKIEFLFSHLKIEFEEQDEPYVTEVKNLIRAGKRDQAVKYLRDATQTGLYEAKSMVDEIAKKL
jgi:ribosomal protein L7/L12